MIALYRWNRETTRWWRAVWATVRGERLEHVATARPLWVRALRGQRG